MVFRDIVRFEAGDQSIAAAEADFVYPELEEDCDLFISGVLDRNDSFSSDLGVTDRITAHNFLRTTFP